MSEFDYLTICPHCEEKFKVTEIEQMPGFRWKEELICPYCHKTVRTSMEYEFLTEKL